MKSQKGGGMDGGTMREKRTELKSERWTHEGEGEMPLEDEETITINSIRRNLCFPRERSNC